MENDLFKAYAEVDTILSLMESKYVEKIPLKMREMFKNEKLDGYNPEIDPTIRLDNQNVMRKTIIILAMLNLNYWCENEEEKQKLIKIYADNDIKREEELREKYNPDNIFKNRQKTEQIETTSTALIEYQEENFLKRIIKKVMSLFKRKK